jgi:hypothetical protein
MFKFRGKDFAKLIYGAGIVIGVQAIHDVKNAWWLYAVSLIFIYVGGSGWDD